MLSQSSAGALLLLPYHHIDIRACFYTLLSFVHNARFRLTFICNYIFIGAALLQYFFHQQHSPSCIYFGLFTCFSIYHLPLKLSISVRKISERIFKLDMSIDWIEGLSRFFHGAGWSRTRTVKIDVVVPILSLYCAVYENWRKNIIVSSWCSFLLCYGYSG